MTDVLPNYEDHLPQLKYRHFDITELLLDVDTARQVVDAEKRLTALSLNNAKNIQHYIDLFEMKLNNTLKTDTYIYQPSVVSGYAIDHSATPLRYTDAPFLYGGITFMPIVTGNETSYRGGFSLFPSDSKLNAKRQHFMPFDLTSSIVFPDHTISDFNPDRLLAQLKGIALHSKNCRQESTFQSMTQIEKMHLIEQTAQEYTHLLDPYISQNISLLFDTDYYSIFEPDKLKNSDQRYQHNKDPKKRHIIAGRIAEVTFRTLRAQNPNVPPLLIVDNEDKNIRYEIPLNADFAHIIPLHATTYR